MNAKIHCAVARCCLARREARWLAITPNAVAVSLTLLAARPAVAQVCLADWLHPFPSGGDIDGPVYALAEFDADGSGPAPRALYVGGDFTVAPGVPVSHIARWSGESWSSLGFGLNGPVRAMAVFDDDGNGPDPPALCVGGSFTHAGSVAVNRIARWNGAAWSPLGAGLAGSSGIAEVHAITRYDADGPGGAPPKLCAAGRFSTAGGGAATNIALWDGAAWTPLGAGIGSSSYAVLSLATFDEDGDGPMSAALFAGGDFYSAGGTPAHNLARWNGATWSAIVPSGTVGAVRAFAVHDDDGSGPLPSALYIGGYWLPGAGVVSRWDGSVWTPITAPPGAQFFSSVFALASLDPDGAGPESGMLYVGGSFVMWNTPWLIAKLARWNGTSWFGVGPAPSGDVHALLTTAGNRDSSPVHLLVGGTFDQIGGIDAKKVARWNETTWFDLPATNNAGMDGPTYVLHAFDRDGAGPEEPALYAGGSFVNTNGQPAGGIARWNGSNWQGVGGGMSSDGVSSLAVVRALHGFDEDGEGPQVAELFAGGDFDSAGGANAPGLARWDGTEWSPVTGWHGGQVESLLAFDEDGPGPQATQLYVGGAFIDAESGVSGTLARWDGSAWSAVGAGLHGGGNRVLALCEFDDDGPGPNLPALYAGGDFAFAGALVVNRIARWDGVSWSPLGSGLQGQSLAAVRAFAVFPDNGAPSGVAALYVGGTFDSAGGVSASGVARWDGASWAPAGIGISNVFALASIDHDGAGPGGSLLYAGKPGTSQTDSRLWRLLDGTWVPVGGAGLGAAWTLAVIDWPHDAAPPALWVGGFVNTENGPIAQVGTWGCPSASGDSDGDFDLDLFDYAAFTACLADPGVIVASGCAFADMNPDLDVDLADFAVFERAFVP